MSSTRYSQQPLQIYQDPGSAFDRASMPSANIHHKRSSPLRPLKNAGSRNSVIFNPPQAGKSRPSPHKPYHHTSSSPSRAVFSNKLNMISMPPPGQNLYSTDSIEKKQPTMTKFKPQKALFTTFQSENREKENYPQRQTHYAPLAPNYDGLSHANFSLEGIFPRPAQSSLPQKRQLMDAAPIHETRPFKRAKIEENLMSEDLEPMELPPPDSFPAIHDDGTKPSHSYATLIGMSILRAPHRRLTLAQIYKWISDTYSFYGATDAGWQNSIRHNLSLNKAFIKQERPKDDPGKGNYWAIQPGMEHQFLKDKTVRKIAGPNENVPVLNANLAPVDQQHEPRFKTLIPAPIELPPQPRQPLPETRLSEPQLPAAQEISSDATIPASDAANTDPEAEEDLQEPQPSSPLIQSSPPMAMMHSSPPVPRHVSKRQDTPPPVPLFGGSSRSRSHSHKRKNASMDDSGYFSSLDSSAMRPHRLISDARTTRGRAEEEIARLRGSSYDSPTKPKRPASFLSVAPSSSPMRRVQMGPPLTPAIKLKPPTRAPPSVSPNTHLRLHRDRVREMVGSPLRGMTVLEETPWSPAFNLETGDTSYLFQDNLDLSHSFDIFDDNALQSPEKRSVKRPRLDRSRSANILADISNSASSNKNITSTPLLKFTPSTNLALPDTFSSPLKMQSPFNLAGGNTSLFNSPSKFDASTLSTFSIPGFDDDFFKENLGDDWLTEDPLTVGLVGDENLAVGSEGWDLCAGSFARIGSAAAMSGTTTTASASTKTPKMRGAATATRPVLGGRSVTSRF